MVSIDRRWPGLARGYRFESATGFTLGQLADVITEAFKGYPHQVFESPVRLARLIRVQSLDLHHSLVVRAPDGGLAGVSFLGLRNAHAWISAFGITPPHRGQGVATKLLHELLEQAGAAGAVDVRLEVLATNPVAQHLYARAGFTRLRELVSLERSPQPAMRLAEAAPRLEQVGVDVAVRTAMDLDAGEACWQRQPSALLTGSSHALLARAGRTVAGAALFSMRDGTVALHHLASRPELVDDVLPSVVLSLLRRTGVRYVTVLNEPNHGGLLPAYFAHGFKETMRQYELFRRLV